MVVKKTGHVVYTAHDNKKTHDFRVLQNSRLSLHTGIRAKLDSGYQGIEQLNRNSQLLKKDTKHPSLNKKEKAANIKLARERVIFEHVIGRTKVFCILAECYRDRRQKHNPTIKLICDLYNYVLK